MVEQSQDSNQPAKLHRQVKLCEMLNVADNKTAREIWYLVVVLLLLLFQQRTFKRPCTNAQLARTVASSTHK